MQTLRAGGSSSPAAGGATTSLLQSGIESGVEPADLEADWLSTTAAVRPQLARLEALQLEAHLLGTMAPLDVRRTYRAILRKRLVNRCRSARRRRTTRTRPAAAVSGFGAAQALQGENVAVALIDQFTEAVPLAEHSTYAAFGFNAPAARPRQAISFSRCPAIGPSYDSDVLLDILRRRQNCSGPGGASRGRCPVPATPTMWFDGASPLRLRLDNGTQYWRSADEPTHRLVRPTRVPPRRPEPPERLRRRVHDPLWLLAREWEMGEHQGENASSPVRVDCMLSRTPQAAAGRPRVRPGGGAGKALVEVRTRQLVDNGTADTRRAEIARVPIIAGGGGWIADPPRPRRGPGIPTGVPLARAGDLPIAEGDFGDDRPPPDSPLAWNTSLLNYKTSFETDERPLEVIDHHGGPLDWYSADADTTGASAR